MSIGRRKRSSDANESCNGGDPCQVSRPVTPGELANKLLAPAGYSIVKTERLASLRALENYKPSESVFAEHLRRVFEKQGVDCVFDVGANDGTYAQWLRSDVGYRGCVVSFEPIAAQVRALEQKAAGDPMWIVRDCALGAEEGSREFHVMESDVFSSFLKPADGQPGKYSDSNRVSRSIPVKVSTVAAAWREISVVHGVSRLYLKMDTQGFDLEVFAGAQDVLASIVALQSELAFRTIYEGGADAAAAMATFAAAGYRPSMLHPISFDEGLGMIEADGIFVRG